MKITLVLPITTTRVGVALGNAQVNRYISLSLSFSKYSLYESFLQYWNNTEPQLKGCRSDAKQYFA